MKSSENRVNRINFLVFIFTVLLVSPGLIKGQASQGFFLNDWAPRTVVIPKFTDVVKPSGYDVTVTVNAADTVAKVSPYIFGNNANIWSTIMYNNPELVKHLKDLNPHVLRYPGGNLSNDFFWDLKPGERPEDIPQDIKIRVGNNPATSTMSVDNYYKFLKTVGATGIICVNYAYARYGLSSDPVVRAAHYAAEWVRYDNGRTKFWEIGNENYGKWEDGFTIDTTVNKDGQPHIINGRLYGSHCRVFIDSMKAAASEKGHTIYIGVVAWKSATSSDPVEARWNQLMIPEVADKTDFYIVHDYYTKYQENSDAQTILNTYKKSEEFKASVFDALKNAGYGPAPIALTEWNIFAVGSQQQVSQISGIHATLVLGELIKGQYGLAARWDLANGWNKGNDHGMFSEGGEPGVDRFAPRPVFYYMTFFQRYFGDVMIKSIGSGNDDIISYASRFSNGPMGLVVVNKGDQEHNVKIDMVNFDPGSRYYWYTLEGGKLNGQFSRQVVINGFVPGRVAGGPLDYDRIKAYSATTEGGIVVDAKPYTVQYILVDGQ